MSLVYLNGFYLPADEACVPIADRGLAYGDGVFTTIKVSGGAPHFLAWHLDRLRGDASGIYISPPGAGMLTDACLGLISRLGLESGVLKITITRGAGGRGPSTRNADRPMVLVTASEPPAPRPPLRATSVPDTRGPLAAHKTLNYLPNILALREAEAVGCDEALFFGESGLLEGTVSNLIGVCGEEIRTPPLDGKMLPGTARRALLRAGIVREGLLPAHLEGPLYCINSVRGIEAVAVLDGRPLVRKKEIQTSLQEAMEDQRRQADLD